MALCLATPNVEPRKTTWKFGRVGFRLSDGQGQDASQAGSGPSGQKLDGPLNGISVLVVDDERDSRDMLLAFFIRYGAATVRVARDVSEARRMLGDWQPDIILSDIAMPNEDGIAFIRQFREQQVAAGRKPIPAVAMTGFTQDVHRWQALHAGYQAYLPKPLDLPNLLETIIRLARE
jgi:CheY-like chemotaxis protein